MPESHSIVWMAGSGGVWTTAGYPKLVFDGILKDGEIDLKLNGGSILTTGEERNGHKLDMWAKRASE